MTAYPPCVLLAELTERTSTAGNRYVSGFLGKAWIIGFWGEGEDRDGNPTTVLRLFVQEPVQRAPQARQGAQERQEQPARLLPADATSRGLERGQRAAADARRRHGDAMANLNDPIPT